MSFEFCLPTTGTKVPADSEWLHEIKYDGYRLRMERDGDRVRPITRGDRNPLVSAAARKLKALSFVIAMAKRCGST